MEVVRTTTVHCPLCGLRFRAASALDQHARDDHAPPLAPEAREVIRVPRHRRAAELETALDRVLGSRGLTPVSRRGA